MGNHEFNAGMFHSYRETAGEKIPLRPHDEKNMKQHKAFLNEYIRHPVSGRKHIEWIKNLPLFLDFDGFRLVHATWDEAAVALLQKEGVLDEKNRIRPDQWDRLEDYKSPVGKAAERLTKGHEMMLPEGLTYIDPDGNGRDRARLKWWADLQKPLTLADVTLDIDASKIPATPLARSL